MKKSALFLLPIIFLSCGEQKEDKEHHFIVVHNNYKDTTEVVAKYWKTKNISKLDRYDESVKSITEFTSYYGTSLIYNVDCIIAKDSISNK